MNEYIINCVKNGDKKAFQELYSIYSLKVMRTVCLLLNSRNYSEDIVQEIFIRVYANIHKLTNPEAFESWLYKITFNVCMDFIKKVKKASLELMDETELVQDDIRICQDTPEEAIIKKEIHDTIMEVIQAFPLKHSTVLTLFYFNDFSIKEIADILDCSQGTVKSRLFYAKKIFKRKLKEKGVYNSEYDDEEEIVHAIR